MFFPFLWLSFVFPVNKRASLRGLGRGTGDLCFLCREGGVQVVGALARVRCFGGTHFLGFLIPLLLFGFPFLLLTLLVSGDGGFTLFLASTHRFGVGACGSGLGSGNLDLVLL